VISIGNVGAYGGRTIKRQSNISFADADGNRILRM
jgi:hypothetical protein